MKVSFTGSYLYTFSNRNVRNIFFNLAYEKKFEKDKPNYDVFKINDNEMLIVNGQDYKDLRDILSLNNKIGLYTMKAQDRTIGTYLNKALKIKCTDLDLNL